MLFFYFHYTLFIWYLIRSSSIVTILSILYISLLYSTLQYLLYTHHSLHYLSLFCAVSASTDSLTNKALPYLSLFCVYFTRLPNTVLFITLLYTFNFDRITILPNTIQGMYVCMYACSCVCVCVCVNFRL